MKKIKKILKDVSIPIISKKEKTFDDIIISLSDIEEKTTLRKQTITEKIETLKFAKKEIEDTIKRYETEMEKCNKFLTIINNYT